MLIKYQTLNEFQFLKISLSPLYHVHPLCGYLDINRAITAENSSLPIGGSRTQRTFGFQAQVDNHLAMPTTV